MHKSSTENSDSMMSQDERDFRKDRTFENLIDVLF